MKANGKRNKHIAELRHTLMYLPVPRENPDLPGEALIDATGAVIVDHCSPEEAILNRTTGKYQSGDVNLYALIKTYAAQVETLDDALRRTLDSALRHAGVAHRDALRPPTGARSAIGAQASAAARAECRLGRHHSLAT
jgi:hypothetical protein